jgi:hypothetical protein
MEVPRDWYCDRYMKYAEREIQFPQGPQSWDVEWLEVTAEKISG